MKNRSFIIELVLLICVVTSSFFTGLNGTIFNASAYASDTVESFIDEEIVSDDFEENSVIVTLTIDETRKFLEYGVEDFPEIEAAQVIDLTDGVYQWVQKKINNEPTEKEMLVNIDKFRRILKIELAESGKENVLSAIESLKYKPGLLSVAPNYEIKASSSSTGSDGSNNEGLWGFEKIHAQEAWAISGGEREEVVIGVMDSGIDATHEALEGKIHENVSLHDDFTGDGDPFLDTFGHGTHVAGSIAGKIPNGPAIGLACDANVKLVSLKIFDSYGNSRCTEFIDAITHAQRYGIKILNFSGEIFQSRPQEEAAVRSYTGLLVCAAGTIPHNWGTDSSVLTRYPAGWGLSNVISVGASDVNNVRAALGEGSGNSGSYPYSNFGDMVDVYAPGRNILSAASADSNAQGEYIIAHGTSMATPYVTALAAIMYSLDATLTPSDIKTIIEGTADTQIEINPEEEDYDNAKLINAYKAVEAVAYKVENGALTAINFEPNGELKIPENIMGQAITSIGAGVFENASNLTEIWLPSSITEIGENAFKNSGLQEFYIGEQNSVVELEQNAFSKIVIINNEVRIYRTLETTDGVMDFSTIYFDLIGTTDCDIDYTSMESIFWHILNCDQCRENTSTDGTYLVGSYYSFVYITEGAVSSEYNTEEIIECCLLIDLSNTAAEQCYIYFEGEEDLQVMDIEDGIICIDIQDMIENGVDSFVLLPMEGSASFTFDANDISVEIVYWVSL